MARQTDRFWVKTIQSETGISGWTFFGCPWLIYLVSSWKMAVRDFYFVSIKNFFVCDLFTRQSNGQMDSYHWCHHRHFILMVHGCLTVKAFHAVWCKSIMEKLDCCYPALLILQTLTWSHSIFWNSICTLLRINSNNVQYSIWKTLYSWSYLFLHKTQILPKFGK